MLNVDGERVMAWVVKIDDVVKHPDADLLDICQVGGWKVVTRLGEFKKGDLAVYASIDSWIPSTVAPFLSKGKDPRVYQEIPGERLKTVRLRGVISQGLLLPLDIIPGHINHWVEGDDCSRELGIIKYEPPIPAALAGLAKGNFPSWLSKTDLERLQNLSKDLEQWSYNQMLFEITEKIDGSSMTVYFRDGEFGVCSRNLELKEDDNNAYWRAAKSFNLREKLQTLNKNIALQMELAGPKIQGNPYKLSDYKIYLFDVFDIDSGEYMSPYDRYLMVSDIDIPHVPIVDSRWEMSMTCTMDDLLNFAEGKSQLWTTTEREGLAFKSLTGRTTFKVISNSFLIKTGG